MFHYLICSTARVGSNLLCSLLNGTRVVGHPQEFFCPFTVADLGPKLCGLDSVTNTDELHRFIDAAAATYSSQGRFGIKAHYLQLQAALQAGYDLEGRFPDRFVHVTRADVLGQAMSYVRASQTGAWTAQREERCEHRFQPELIRATIQRLNAENHAWEVLFQRYDVEPYRLSYERLCADFEGELARLLAHLDVDPTTVDVAGAVTRATKHFKTQRDAVSAEWRERYLEWVKRRAQLQHDSFAARHAASASVTSPAVSAA